MWRVQDKLISIKRIMFSKNALIFFFMVPDTLTYFIIKKEFQSIGIAMMKLKDS